MQMTPDLNGDGGRHKAQLEPGRERGRGDRGGVGERAEGGGVKDKKNKKIKNLGCFNANLRKSVVRTRSSTKAHASKADL